MHHFFRPGLCLIAVLFAGQLVAAEDDAIGRVVAISGEATVIHSDGSSTALQRRSSLQAGDRIQTGPASWLQVRFVDSAILSLSCNSSLIIREYQHLDLNSDRSQLHLESGRARTITGTIQRSNYRFTARQLEIRPSGTDFEVLIDEKDNVYFGVYDGAIRIDSGQDNLLLGANQPAQYASFNSETGLAPLSLRPALFGNGVLGGVECP